MTCDQCPAPAAIVTILDTDLPLYWCNHHHQTNQEALAAYTILTLDLQPDPTG